MAGSVGEESRSGEKSRRLRTQVRMVWMLYFLADYRQNIQAKKESKPVASNKPTSIKEFLIS